MKELEKFWQQISWLITVALLTILAYLYVSAWYQALYSPLPIGYESPNFYNAWLLSQGKNIYASSTLESSPWAVTIFPPIYIALVSLFQKSFGVNYWSGHLITIGASILTTVYLFKILKNTGASIFVATVSLVAFLSFSPIWEWSFLARADMLSLFFGAVSLERFIAKYKCEQKEFSINAFLGDYWISILFSVAAIFTKQPAIVIPISIAVFLLFSRRVKDSIAYALFSAFLSLLVLVALNMVTSGGFLDHMQFISQMPFELKYVTRNIFWIGLDLLKFAMLPVFVLIWLLNRKNHSENSYTVLPMILSILSGCLCFYTIGMEYASANHAIIVIFAFVWLCAILVKAKPLSSSLLLLASAANVYVLSSILPWYFSYQEKMQTTVDKISDKDFKGQLILTEDPILALEMNAVPEFVDLAAVIGIWKKTNHSFVEVENSLAEKKYAAVIINHHDAYGIKPSIYWDEGLVELINRNYINSDELLGNMQPNVLFLPKNSTDHSKE